jgi:hypothetical protein
VAALVLTKAQWTELVEAIESKALAVRRGDYMHESDYKTPEGAAMDQERWAQDLDRLLQVITESLNSQGVVL